MVFRTKKIKDSSTEASQFFRYITPRKFFDVELCQKVYECKTPKTLNFDFDILKEMHDFFVKLNISD